MIFVPTYVIKVNQRLLFVLGNKSTTCTYITV